MVENINEGRGVGGQKTKNLVNVVKECTLTTCLWHERVILWSDICSLVSNNTIDKTSCCFTRLSCYYDIFITDRHKQTQTAVKSLYVLRYFAELY